MNILIRTDASIEIGTGHVMRCLTLAKQLKRHGAKVTFVCRDLEGNRISYLKGQGMKVKTLVPIEKKENEHDIELIKLNWKKDAKETAIVLEELNLEFDFIVVDHYGLDNRWESELRDYTKQILVIDDLANRPHNCDLLLDQNYYLNMNERYQGLLPERCVQILGPSYVLLRDEFLKTVDKPRKRTGEVKNILIFFGGTDPTGETIKVLEAIQELDLLHIEINVVVGETNSRRKKIEQICSEMKNTYFYCQVSNMANLMNIADLAIGAGGATTWERCILGLPSLTIIVANNQKELTKTLKIKGAIIDLGDSADLSIGVIQKSIINLLNNPEEVKRMCEKCTELVDIQLVRSDPVTNKILGLINESQ